MAFDRSDTMNDGDANYTSTLAAATIIIVITIQEASAPHTCNCNLHIHTTVISFPLRSPCRARWYHNNKFKFNLQWQFIPAFVLRLFTLFSSRSSAVLSDGNCYRLLKQLKQHQQGLTLLVFLCCVPVVDNIVAEIIKQNSLQLEPRYTQAALYCSALPIIWGCL